MGRTVAIGNRPQRIISIVPSQTELLYDLGLRDEVAGITRYCIRPEEWFRAKPRIGGTKDLHFESIEKLQPDLIIGNKEENERQQVEELMKHCPVWMSDVHSLTDALDMIAAIGEITGKGENARELADRIQDGFRSLVARIRTESLEPRRTAYLIWRRPYMVAGPDTFIHHMLGLCGLENVFAGRAGHYPEVTADELRQADPGLVLLSSEPYPFKEKHIPEFADICPGARVLTVDGEMFSWYGSRLLYAPDYLTRLMDGIQPAK